MVFTVQDCGLSCEVRPWVSFTHRFRNVYDGTVWNWDSTSLLECKYREFIVFYKYSWWKYLIWDTARTTRLPHAQQHTSQAERSAYNRPLWAFTEHEDAQCELAPARWAPSGRQVASGPMGGGCSLPGLSLNTNTHNDASHRLCCDLGERRPTPQERVTSPLFCRFIAWVLFVCLVLLLTCLCLHVGVLGKKKTPKSKTSLILLKNNLLFCW